MENQDHGVVEIRCTLTDAGWFRAEIEDNGIGLQNQETDEIFSPLISSWDPPGTGMGLFRVKQIVDAMKGQIKITKGSKLKGVLAYIEIPPSGGGTTKMFD